MRDLTEEELALAPEWVTHYIIDSIDGDVIYESAEHCWWKGLRFRMGNFTFDKSKSRLIERKPFDITQHEWSDSSVDCVFTNTTGDIGIEFNCDLSEFLINKKDVIAMAKYFNLTAEDLK